MSAGIEQFDRKARREFEKLGHTEVRRGELLRYSLYTRFLHWSTAITFILALLTGFAVYSPSLFPFLTPLFGGGPDDAVSSPVVWHCLRPFLLLPIPELAGTDGMD